ncbi:MAG: hypothetical protein LBS41_00540 [Streptococcaceae bacterium]|nr:hypothetical protein [Streptococcaceae bacterium]
MVKSILDQFQSDPLIKQAFDQIDYESDCFYQTQTDNECFNDFVAANGYSAEENEAAVDKLLLLLNYLIYLKELKLLSDDELGLLHYQLYKTLDREEIQDYLNFTAQHAQSQDMISPFGYLISYERSRHGRTKKVTKTNR